MAEYEDQKPIITVEDLKSKFSVTHFDHNAIIRGAQLTVVGGEYTAIKAHGLDLTV